MDMSVEKTRSLRFDIKDLASPVHAVVGINTVWTEKSAIHRIAGQFGRLVAIGTAAESAATLGLFTFGIGHDV